MTHVILLQVETADDTDPNDLLIEVAEAVTGIARVIPGTVTVFPAPTDLAMPVLSPEPDTTFPRLPATLFDDLIVSSERLREV